MKQFWLMARENQRYVSGWRLAAQPGDKPLPDRGAESRGEARLAIELRRQFAIPLDDARKRGQRRIKERASVVGRGAEAAMKKAGHGETRRRRMLGGEGTIQ